MTDRTDFCAELIKGYLDEIELLERELAEVMAEPWSVYEEARADALWLAIKMEERE
jgi:uncharacterized protein (UPF0335 family)